MRTWPTSLLISTVIVGLSAAGAMILSPMFPQWPWLMVAAPLLPAGISVLILGGGPHEMNGSPYAAPLTLSLSLVLWWAAIEWGRNRRRTRRGARRVSE